MHNHYRLPRFVAALAAPLMALAPSVLADEQTETEIAANVAAAIESAVRGTAHPDDLHPMTLKTGKPLSAIQAAFDVRHYALDLRILPDARAIQGSVAVSLAALSDLSAVEFDLDPKLGIADVTHDGVSLVVSREADSFTAVFPEPLAAGEQAVVTITYGGEPHVAFAPPWNGGFVWSEAEGKPWFATAVQTEGCDLWWPCKDTYADKPEEGVTVSVAAPRGIKVASVGTLAGVTEGDDGFDTWHWQSRHPYTGYAIAINGGPYELIETEYQGINGTTYPIQFWALPENAEKAEQLIASDAIPDLASFERLLGPYPWGDEKVGFVETPHLGMEHQTINAYGEQYQRGKHGFDNLLHHELAHEWFGNVMTHERPEDAWIHEGYAAYMQAVYAEETMGALGYYDNLYSAYTSNAHCLPPANPEVGDVGEAFENSDIYTKGSWMLHTLRRYIGDKAFWAGTRELIYDTDTPWDLAYPITPRYRNTEEFIEIMSRQAGEDIGWLVETYLRETGMPDLETSRSDGQLYLRWKVPGGRAFPMPVTVSLDGEKVVVAVGSEMASLAVDDHVRVIIDPDSDILRSLPIIDGCTDRTESQTERRLKRFREMARDYGWQR